MSKAEKELNPLEKLRAESKKTEIELFEWMLSETDGVVLQVSKRFKIPLRTVWSRIRKLGLDPNEFRE